VFNRYGQHLSTVDLLTGVQLYNFTYNVHSYFGRLLKVTDNGGQQMTIRRDYKLVARDIWVCCLYFYLFILAMHASLCVVLWNGLVSYEKRSTVLGFSYYTFNYFLADLATVVSCR